MFESGLINRLPQVRGSYRENEPLAPLTWFRVGGPAQVLFKPKDAEDLAHFIKHKPADVPVMMLGVGSNMLVRDGGVPGIVVRLPASFGRIAVDGNSRQVTAGAFALDRRVAQEAAKAGIGGLAFFAGIPGTIGGALRMNAGAHGGETKDYLVKGRAISPEGELVELDASDYGHSYRNCALPADWIFVDATFQGTQSDSESETKAVAQVDAQREATQPIKSRTGGSTFKNPVGYADFTSAWRVVDAAGMRGHRIGDAQVSEMHCNFLLNLGEATAFDIETLGESVRAKAFAATGVTLHWEIKRIGVFEPGSEVDIFAPPAR